MSYKPLIVVLAVAALLFPFFFAHSFSQAASTPTNFDDIDTYIETFIRNNRMPGLSLVIVQNDQTVFARGYGIADASGRPVTPQTPFILGSTSKSFTALAVMQLVEAGKIDLDAPVQRYLPWFDLGNGAITVRNLLNHTSGIPQIAGQEALSFNDSDAGALERQVRGLSRWPLAHTPGSTFEYANANYQTAGLIVQTVSGEPFETYVQQHIFNPLEMVHSYTSKTEAQKNGLASGYHFWFGLPVPAGDTPYPREHFPSGYFISTAEDMAHALILHLNDGAYKGNQILSAQDMAVLHHPVLDNYAMGWELSNGVLVHNGSVPDYGSQILVDPVRKLGIAVLFNINNAIGADHLYIVGPNVLNLLTHSILAPTPSESTYMTVLILIPALLALEIIWLVWSLARLRRWQNSPDSRPHGLLAALYFGLPPVFEIGLGAALWSQMTEGIPNALLHQPDLTIIMLALFILLAGWGILRTITGLRWLLFHGVEQKHTTKNYS